MIDYPQAILVTTTTTLLVLGAYFLATRRRPHRPTSNLRRSWLSMLLTAGVAVCVAVLTATAFRGTFVGELSGWTLFVHLAAAGPFVVLISLFSIWGVIRARQRGTLARVSFVAILFTTLGTLGTIVVSMQPVFGTEEMHQLLDVHRVFGLALALCTLVYLCAVAIERPSGQVAPSKGIEQP